MKNQKLFYDAIGKRLTQEAQRKKLTVQSIVRKSGEQHHTVTRLLQGERSMVLPLANIARALDLDLQDLINYATTEGKHENEIDDLI